MWTEINFPVVTVEFLHEVSKDSLIGNDSLSVRALSESKGFPADFLPELNFVTNHIYGEYLSLIGDLLAYGKIVKLIVFTSGCLCGPSLYLSSNFNHLVKNISQLRFKSEFGIA